MTASEYLSEQRVNIELILWKSDKNILHYGVRIRPWKQETRTGVMILAQGLTVEDSIKNAARAHYNASWEKLDYAARPWLVRQPTALDSPDAQTLDFLAPTNPQDAVFDQILIDPPGVDLKKRQLRS